MPIIVQYDDPSLILTAGTNAGNFAAEQQIKQSNVAQQNANTNQQQVAQQGTYQQGELGQGQQRINNQSDQFYDAEDFQKQQAQDQFQRQQVLSNQANTQRLQQISAMGDNRMNYGQNVVLPQQQMRDETSIDNTATKSGAITEAAGVRADAMTDVAGIRAGASTDNAMIHANAMTQRPGVQGNPETQGRLAGQQVIEQHNASQRGIGFQIKAMQMDPRVSAELLDPTSASSQRYQSLMGQYQANEQALPGKIKAAQDNARAKAANTASAMPQPPAEAQPNSPGANLQKLPSADEVAPQAGQLVYVYNTNANQAVSGRFAGYQRGPNGQQAALVNIPGHGPQLFDPQHVLLPGANRVAGNGVPMQTNDDGNRATMQRDQSNPQQPMQYQDQNAQTSGGGKATLSPVDQTRGGGNSPVTGGQQPSMDVLQQVRQQVNQSMAGRPWAERKAKMVEQLQQAGYDTSGL